MKYVLGIAIIVVLWSVARNWQQVQRLKARQAQANAIDERFAQAKANLDIAYANDKFSAEEYRRRVQALQGQWQKEHKQINNL